MAGKAVEKRTGTEVDPRDEPSAEWGWHGSFPKAARAGAWATAAIMFLMLIGNHQNRTEDVVLIVTGVGIIVFLLFDLRRRRTAWRR
ncbi:DUF2631 domain-containing protein [Saccharomonospora piscinae]|uniref:DUF2631 domain-containing protein n=1 Tax=Saccharomonospora piscinae TaxID=687388 RepID=A0A1V8ZZ19_SACPI|nr:DUF2631 domain-containing protein [Saccharomonospora piscinae]OQO90159.1 hypothetical protein B1813_20030 [Saccharomonospora piscinae]TLW90937.1 DUF2631 domain-containing protein [Saccharomonospora piscinae]